VIVQIQKSVEDIRTRDREHRLAAKRFQEESAATHRAIHQALAVRDRGALPEAVRALTIPGRPR
jgi:DNA-binding FadR family transcriptional regulator